MSATPPEADLAWHYTSGASLLSILQNDVLWATAAPFLNDAQEIAIGYRRILEVLPHAAGG